MTYTNCCVCSTRLLMMNIKSVRNKQSSISKINLRNQCVSLVLLQEYITMHGPLNVKLHCEAWCFKNTYQLFWENSSTYRHLMRNSNYFYQVYLCHTYKKACVQKENVVVPSWYLTECLEEFLCMKKKIIYLANQKVLTFFPESAKKESQIFTRIAPGIKKNAQ